MAVISSPTYDPTTTATNLANAYVAPTKAILDKQTTQATAVGTGLTTLSAALSAFQGTLQGLASSTSSVSATKATFSNTSVATATAKPTAAAGTYSFYVQQLATAGQMAYNVPTVTSAGGSMSIALNTGAPIGVDLTTADSNNDGFLSAKELAAAINASPDNKSRITASTITVNNVQQLVLTSTQTGKDNAVAAITTAGGADPGLTSDLGAGNTLTDASNAIVWAGGKNGTKVEQASNTFSIVDDVSFTVTQAQGVNDAAVSLTVGPDSSGTASNVQKFVDAYNTLLAALNKLTAPGDHTVVESTDANGTPTATAEDAAFYNDAGVTNLRDRLGSILRSVTGGQSLISFGITATKDGSLTLDSSRLNKAIAANPSGLDTLFGRAGIGVDSGALGAMNKLVTSWTTSAGGFISQRTTQNDKLQSDLADRQATVKDQFTNAYKRFLAQFSALQQLQSSMTSTSNMFTAMFSSDSSS
ncbi:flagellar filament capping protein FliD [Pseudoduganella sp. FT25W]|jgi:flagellar hook-associated protein 2|uniref:Flagellar hook-associated protein 2 n=1 Tax=Duganella alba TaxID=2666081 RepID=A0A6L5QK22_9BURK|nr:flagellar filament capping protein FliD [Duganella alba]MRX09662.1 flagellar filament capping protein FliD [Duganella alba]MRX19687.1 flagellar filament capping protein FliD [Duganella alba]